MRKKKQKSQSFSRGEIIEWRTSITGEPKWSKAEYHGKNRFGLYVISENTVACCVENIRKIQPDPENEIRTQAEQILGSHWGKSTGKEFDDMTKHHLKYAVDAVIEALKTEVK